VTTIYRDADASNRLVFDPAGRLYACSQGRRAIVRYDTAGTRTVLADRFAGRRLNSPNDLALDARGGVWFTDPRYGDDHHDRELDHCAVYRLAPPEGEAGAWPIRRLSFDTTRPNGILLSFDERILYVTQSDYDRGAARQLRAYAIEDEGSLGPGRVLEEHPVPAGRPTNCTFGGADRTDLYVTTISGHLYRVRNTGRQGALPPPLIPPYTGKA